MAASGFLRRWGLASSKRRGAAISSSRGATAQPQPEWDREQEPRPFHEMPGPKPWPILGNGWRFLPYVGEFHGMEVQQIHRHVYDKYGSICKFEGIPGRPSMVFVYDPKDVEVTFRNEGPWPMRGAQQAMHYYRNITRKEFYEGIGGVLIENGPKWLEARSKVNPPMMQPRIAKQYINPIGDVAQEFIERIYSMRDSKDELPTDFLNELFKWSLESIAYIALDARLGCLVPNLPPDSEPQKMINAVGDFIDCLLPLEFELPIWKIFPTPTWRKFVKALDIFLDVSVKYVNAAMERKEQNKAAQGGTQGGELSVLERLLERMDAKQATVMAQDMLFAGIDTTSCTIAIALSMLSENLDKQEILYQEVKKFLPNKNDIITEEKLEEMKYLKACLKESIRIVPIIGGNARITVKETVLSNYKVPEGVSVLMPFTLSITSEEIFPQSKRFIPERWLKMRPSEERAGNVKDFDAVNSVKRQPFVFLPFGFGPRSCVGKRFAELETEILLAKIVRNFTVEYHYGKMRFVSKILSTPKDPLRFRMTARND